VVIEDYLIYNSKSFECDTGAMSMVYVKVLAVQ